MCCPHRSPLPPYWRRYVSLTHCFLYLSFKQFRSDVDVGISCWWISRLVELIFCLHFSYLLVHLPKLLATVWTRLPLTLICFLYFPEYHYYYYYLIIIINISITIITNTSYHYHYISYYRGGWVSVTRLKFTWTVRFVLPFFTL